MFESFKIKRLQKKIKLQELEYIQQSLSVLESNNRVIDDDIRNGYRILDGNKAYFTESEAREMIGSASKLYYSNPIASGIIETMINFVVGQTMSVTPVDESEEVTAYWENFYTVNKMDKRVKESFRRVLRDGDAFHRFFDSADKDTLLLRFVNSAEIKNTTGKPTDTYGIRCDPDDIEKPEMYLREYTDSSGRVDTESIPADEIIHAKIKVDSDVKRGVSFLVGIAPYLTKYKRWLDDRVELNRLRTVFNVIGNVTGSNSTGAVKTQFSDTNPANTSGVQSDTLKQLPKSGSVLLAKGIEWDLKNLNIAAGDAKADGRAILLMITVGTNLAEYVVTGDTSNANYASTMVSESPMVKAFEAWQDFVQHEIIAPTYSKVISHGIDTGRIPDQSKKTVKEFNKETGEETVSHEVVETSLECEVNFPILIHRDIVKETQSLTVQNGNDWVSNQTCAEKLGYDYEKEQDRILKEELTTPAGSNDINKAKDAEQREAFITRQMSATNITRAEALQLWNDGER